MLHEVTAALAAIESQGEYAVELGLGSEALHIVVQGVGPLHFPISAATAEKLFVVAEPAPFGRGSETLHDPRVRDTGQIDRSRIKVDTRRWRRALEPVLATLRQRLGLAEGVELAVVLDKLLVYGPGQFFAPHQDTERDDDMVGSLVVTLPSSYEGGSIVVKHQMDPFKSEYEGYMGNYGDTMDRWYHRAAIVMWPRARNFVILARMSPAWAIGEISELVKAGAVDEARGRAREILPFWRETVLSEASATFVSRLLAALAVLDDEDLAFELLSPLGPHRLGERTMTAFAALVERHGLAWAKRLFIAWADEKRRPAPPWLASLACLCEALTAGGEHGRALAPGLLSREVATFARQRVSERRGQRPLRRSSRDATVIVVVATWLAVGGRGVHVRSLGRVGSASGNALRDDREGAA